VSEGSISVKLLAHLPEVKRSIDPLDWGGGEAELIWSIRLLMTAIQAQQF
jgi:hypothetical protein